MRVGVESVDPGKIARIGVGFMFAIAQADAGVLIAGRVVFDVIGEGVVGNLEIVAAKRGNEAKLVRWVDIENREPKPPTPLTASCTTWGTGGCSPRSLRLPLTLA